MNVKGIVFDFDGTLATLNVDFPRMREEVCACIKAYGIPEELVTGRYILEMVEAGVQYLIKQDSERHEAFRREAYGVIKKIELSAAFEAGPLEGVPEMLWQLRERGLKTAVVTRNCFKAVELTFPQIKRLVDTVLARDHVPAVKPDPHHLLAALSFLEVQPKEALMVGDHPMDISMGRNVGATTVGVLTGSGRKDELSIAQADYIIDSASYLTTVLDIL